MWSTIDAIFKSALFISEQESSNNYKDIHHQRHRLFCYIFISFWLYVETRFFRHPRGLEDNIHPLYFRGNKVQQLLCTIIVGGILICISCTEYSQRVSGGHMKIR